MKYQPKNFDYLYGTPGFSDQLLNLHFTLYRGYVENTNKLDELLKMYLKDGRTNLPQYAELKRRFGWEFDGMRLHEYYFGNMKKGGSGLDRNSAFYKAILHEFGSWEAWERDFKGVGLMRGIGWAILYYDTQGKRLFNTWINEHDTGHLAGACPLLVMDVFEHAYITQYGLRRPEYIESFFKAIDWAIVAQRYNKQ
ncbi:Fe-Mn family superoxide dismutase [Bacillota bacterium LX-D]|nr:Fe-Mn family superoxide dismutase [Bacillota bacterium LX-D]